MTSLIIVEEDPFMQSRLRSIFEVTLGFARDLVWFADSAGDACRMTAVQPFGLAMVGIGSVDGDGDGGGEGEGEGTDAIRRLHRQNAKLPILALSRWSSRQAVLAVLQAGASGYLLKERDDGEIALFIRSVLRGGCPIDPFVACHILDMARQAAPSLPAGFPIPPLSPREIEVLHLVAKGFANREVSNLLHLSVLTVECHMKNIYRKLEVKSRTQAVFEARAVGLLP